MSKKDVDRRKGVGGRKSKSKPKKKKKKEEEERKEDELYSLVFWFSVESVSSNRKLCICGERNFRQSLTFSIRTGCLLYLSFFQASSYFFAGGYISSFQQNSRNFDPIMTISYELTSLLPHSNIPISSFGFTRISIFSFRLLGFRSNLEVNRIVTTEWDVDHKFILLIVYHS